MIIWNGFCRRLYWIDAKLDYIAFCDYNGANHHTVLRDGAKIRHPFSITLFEDTVYWSDWEGQSVKLTDKFQGGDHALVYDALFKPMDLHVVHPLQQPEGKSYSRRAFLETAETFRVHFRCHNFLRILETKNFPGVSWNHSKKKNTFIDC